MAAIDVVLVTAHQWAQPLVITATVRHLLTSKYEPEQLHSRLQTSLKLQCTTTHSAQSVAAYQQIYISSCSEQPKTLTETPQALILLWLLLSWGHLVDREPCRLKLREHRGQVCILCPLGNLVAWQELLQNGFMLLPVDSVALCYALSGERSPVAHQICDNTPCIDLSSPLAAISILLESILSERRWGMAYLRLLATKKPRTTKNRTYRMVAPADTQGSISQQGFKSRFPLCLDVLETHQQC